jgi:non-canonical purine NTP pyrophosphatase (RdgB/HAM1 family)
VISTTFITGNPNKAAKFSEYIGIDVPHHAADLDEIQTTDQHELIEHKARQAYNILQKPVLVEDVFLTFEALGDLPGPFVKFFVNSGLENMCRMLDGFENRRARAACLYGYFDGHRMEFFSGYIDGTVPMSPRGSDGYGFDPVFEPDGFEGKTAAELSDDDYARFSRQVKPYDAVGLFLKKGVRENV